MGGYVRLFHALADPVRLRVLLVLRARREATVTDLAAAVHMATQAIGYHLSALRSAGLVDFRKAGRFSFYRLAPGSIGPLLAAMFPDPAADPGAVADRLPRT